jgi:hypothetical protein
MRQRLGRALAGDKEAAPSRHRPGCCGRGWVVWKHAWPTRNRGGEATDTRAPAIVSGLNSPNRSKMG